MTFYKIEIKRFDEFPSKLQEYKKIADSGNEEDKGPIYGYVTYEGIKKVETEVLTQTVDTLDLAEVIRAINGL